MSRSCTTGVLRLLFHESAPSALRWALPCARGLASRQAARCGSARLRAHHPLGGPRGTLGRFRGCPGARRSPARRADWGALPGGRAPPTQQLIHGGTELGGGLHRANARRLEGRVLLRRRALAARDDGPGVPHALARRSGDARDIGDHGLADELAELMRGGFLIAPSDLTHGNDAFGSRIALAALRPIDEIHAAYRNA